MRRRLRSLLRDVPPGLALLLAVVLVAMAVSTRQYAAVWRSEATLWAHAVRLAPQKPRVLNNYGVTLAMQGRLQEARAVFERAHQAGHAATLPPWDRREGERTARENLKAVNDLLVQASR